MMSGPELVFAAGKFAARAHQGQMRKDGETPYVAHPFRVCMTVTLVFDVHEPEILAAALLHDTIEDTTTDFDDIVEKFGPRVASYVQAMTKDKRLPDAEREEQYLQQLMAGGWPVHILKLADIYDNLSDFDGISAEKRQRSIGRATYYLENMKTGLTKESNRAFELVRQRLDNVAAVIAH
ncbi:MAG: HD domain-containing protein [Gemmataceae bacterium]